MNKIPISQVVIVEGKYDKITLENVIDATIIPCDGFEIFKNHKQKAVLRAMAKKRGAIILTDSDRAGAALRSHLAQVLQKCEVYMLYTPAIEGKEKRKATASKEGLLGVEGMNFSILHDLFEEFRAEPIPTLINSTHLYEVGLSGCFGAKERKTALLRSLRLPPHLSNNALLKELNRRFTPESFYDFMDRNN